MKCNPLGIVATGLLCLCLFTAGPALSQSGAAERDYAILQAVDAVAGTVVIRDHEYSITSDTDFLNHVGTRASIGDLEPMTISHGLPNQSTGTKVYFEADDDHHLLKLHIVREIPS